MSRVAIAVKVWADKENHPEWYCKATGCLWKFWELDTEREYCPRHIHLKPKGENNG